MQKSHQPFPSRLAPRHRCPSPHAAVTMSQEDTLLSSACDLLTHDWVKSFLFPNDRTTFVRQLQAALSQQTAITARVCFGTHAPGPTITPALSRELSLLCVPSFSTGSITVGFEITACIHDTSPRALGIPRYISRFARDDDEGVMLIVAEHPQIEFTEVTCCALLSPGCRSQIFSLMRSKQLRNGIMKLGDGPSWRARYGDVLKQALAFAYSSIDMRDCPTCGSRSTALCACRLAVKRKAHPLDHDAERENLSTYTGTFGGMAWVRDAEYGNDFRQTFVSSMIAEFTYNRQNRKDLSAWAMTHVFESERLRLGNYEMPMGEIPSVEECSTEESGCVSERCDKRARFENRHFGTRRRGRPGDSITSSISNVELPASVPEFGSPCTPIQDKEHVVETLSSEMRHEPHAQQAQMHDRTQQQSSNVGVPGQVLLNVPTGTLILPIQVPIHDAIQQSLQAVPFRMQGLLPMPTTLTTTLEPARNQRMETPMSKDEIRRARNRASAQRSNEKKKREVAKLKDDLDEFVRRKKVLLERESKLRDENRMLREMLGGIAQAVK